MRKTPSGSALWEKYALSVSRQGNGSVNSTPAGINCGAACAANFSAGTRITLTAQAAADSQFTGWGGACSGTANQCSMIMDGNYSATAYFTAATTTTRLVTLTKNGNGTGSVTSKPNGFNCPANCASALTSFSSNTAITLTAQATAGSQFTGWGGACSGTGNCNIAASSTSTSVTAGFNTHGGGDALADHTAFVTQQYQDFWGRVPDTASLNDWVNRLTLGVVTRAQIVELLLQSEIFQGRLDPIVRLYTAYFKRLPDYSGLMYWYGAMYPSNGSSGSNLIYVSDAFAQSNEFIATYGPLHNAAFIARLYQNVLGRDAEPAGYAYWAGRLADGMPRGEVMLSFSESAENQQASANSQLVTLAYVGMLRRVPQGGEHARWLGDIQAGRVNALNLIDSLLQSPEYRARF